MGRARQLAGRGNNDSLVLDSSAASTDVGELLLLDGTDASSSNAGFSTLQEDATGNAFDGGPFVLSETPISVANPAFRVYLETDQSISDNTHTKITLSTEKLKSSPLLYWRKPEAKVKQECTPWELALLNALSNAKKRRPRSVLKSGSLVVGTGKVSKTLTTSLKLLKPSTQ